MFKIFTNKTAEPQQIMIADGSAFNVAPGNSESVDDAGIFPEELKRLEKFFKIEDVAASASPSPKRTFRTESDEKDGGDE